MSQADAPVEDVSPVLNVAVLRGAVVGVDVQTLQSGTRLGRASLRTRASERTTSVPIVWFDPPAWFETLADDTDLVCVGAVQRRFFQRPGGLGSRVEVVLTHAARPTNGRDRRVFARRVRALLPDAVA